jgi:glutathione S-transferase
MTIVLYGANLSPFVRKVRLFLTEKNIPYQSKRVTPRQVPEGFEKISPLKKIPALTDGDFSLSDSSVICAYIEKKYPEPRLYPDNHQDYGRALWLEEYADTEMALVIGRKLFYQKVMVALVSKQQPDLALIQEGESQIGPIFDYLNNTIHLIKNPQGCINIADISIWTQLISYTHAGYEIDRHRWPVLFDFLSRMQARFAVKKLVEEDQADLAYLKAL